MLRSVMRFLLPQSIRRALLEELQRATGSEALRVRMIERQDALLVLLDQKATRMATASTTILEGRIEELEARVAELEDRLSALDAEKADAAKTGVLQSSQ